MATKAATAADLSIDRLDLSPAASSTLRKLGSLPIAGSINEASVERTIEGASTLTITIVDPDWSTLTSGLLDTNDDGSLEAIDVTVDDLWFRLAKVEAQDDATIALTFEDRDIAHLRRHRSPRSMSRAKATRAQFARALVREVRSPAIAFFAPEANQRQAIETPSSLSKSKRTAAQKRLARGVGAGAKITVKGKPATAEQLRNLETILEVAHRLKAPERAQVAMVAAAIGESSLLKSARNGSHVGVFQSNQIPASDLAGQATYFLKGGRSFAAGGAIGAAKDHPSWTAGEIAAHVEVSDQAGRFYQAFAKEAAAAVAIVAGGGGRGGIGEADTTVVKDYRFARKRGEDSWTCLQRLAEEVNWRCFTSNGVLYFVSEDYLFTQRSTATVSRWAAGVRSLTFEWNVNRRVNEATLVVSADRWTTQPGEVFEIEHAGPANGRWLVHSVSRSLFDTETTIELSKPNLRKAEPAPETETVQGSEFDAAAGVTNVDPGVQKAFAAAKRIDARDTRYSWGGGHNAQFAPSGPNNGYDCSGFVSAVLHAGGFLDRAMGTGELIRQGKPGKGRVLTMWVRETGDPHQSHTFLTFETGSGTVYAEAGGANSGHTGFHKARSTAGFTARHFT